MDSGIDYFISYTTADRQKAEWIAWWLEKIGHKIIFDKWDFKPGQLFPVEMHKAIRSAKKIIAILSNHYLNNESYASAEWSAVFNSGKLLTIKVESFENNVEGLFKSIIHIDLTSARTKEEFIECLENGIKASQDGENLRPKAEPFFPFLLTGSEQTTAQSAKESSRKDTESNINRENTPDFKAGLVDKDEQARHILDATKYEFHINSQTSTPPLSFLLYGAVSQWPEALLNILYYQIKKELSKLKTHLAQENSPEIEKLASKSYKYTGTYENYLWNLLDDQFRCGSSKQEIESYLSTQKTPYLLYRSLTEIEYSNQNLVCGILEAWESLELATQSPRHFLILFYEKVEQAHSNWAFWKKKQQTLPELIQEIWPEKSSRYLLPELTSVNKHLILEWINEHCKSSNPQKIIDLIESKIKRDLNQKIKPIYFKQIADDQFEIHHSLLNDILVETLTELTQST